MNWELERLYIIEKELLDSDYKPDDIKKALSDIYETFEGYYGIRSEMDEWNIDESGEIIEHTNLEIKAFHNHIKYKIYKMLIEKEYKALNNLTKSGLELEYEKGRRYGYRSALLDIKFQLDDYIKEC